MYIDSLEVVWGCLSQQAAVLCDGMAAVYSTTCTLPPTEKCSCGSTLQAGQGDPAPQRCDLVHTACEHAHTIPSHTGQPLDLVQPDTLRWKVYEPILLLGKHRFANVDVRIRVKGGGRVSQAYGTIGGVFTAIK